MSPETLLAHEAVLRLALFLAVFAAMAAWELAAPRRAVRLPPRRRWPANVGVAILNTLVVRVLFPGAAVGVALSGEADGWGLLNQYPVPAWAAVAAGIILLDLAIYLQHVMFHAVPALWRLHRMHHADLEFDVTTGVRFHPLEIVLSMLIKLAVIAALGVPAAAVLLFEVLLNASSMFNHGNVRIPAALDRMLRRLLVTPDMHRVHHSIERDETNSNFGFSLAVWDRWFGTYREAPRAGHQAMKLGVAELRDPAQCASLPGMLAIPFHGEVPAPHEQDPYPS